MSAQGGDTPEHDDDEDLETDAFVLSDGGEEMPPTPLEGTGDDDTADAPMEGPEPAPSPKAHGRRGVQRQRQRRPTGLKGIYQQAVER
ncbi:MAG: hypothetical protein ACLRJV_22650 [Eubacteriales bacterium]